MRPLRIKTSRADDTGVGLEDLFLASSRITRDESPEGNFAQFELSTIVRGLAVRRDWTASSFEGFVMGNADHPKAAGGAGAARGAVIIEDTVFFKHLCQDCNLSLHPWQ